MWRFSALAALILSVSSVSVFADDKKQPPLPSLAEEAAKLAEQRAPDTFWKSGEITVMTGGLVHTAEKGTTRAAVLGGERKDDWVGEYGH